MGRLMQLPSGFLSQLCDREGPVGGELVSLSGPHVASTFTSIKGLHAGRIMRHTNDSANPEPI
ncbi:hypothetical protein COMA1_30412 [Candidatus Nitrospira nitrosa]|uniref:Uncharacterized protein n=1 Tax=Candidatus Nitrospira nitrosa TaxID=1742972 RepID=A0A0S4LHT6_9BACT|nr:hypothetical protein COMA1_30412 [Candidatus Nitrospira nitrosa]